MRSALERVPRRREQTLEREARGGLGVAGPDLVCERIYSGLLSLIKQSTKDSNEAALHSPTAFRSIAVSPANLAPRRVLATLQPPPALIFPLNVLFPFRKLFSVSVPPLRMSLVPKQSFRSLSSPHSPARSSRFSLFGFHPPPSPVPPRSPATPTLAAPLNRPRCSFPGS